MMSTSRTAFRFSRHIALRAALIMVAFMLSVGHQARSAEPPDDIRLPVDQLLHLIDERLAIAPDVARAKWNSGASINAPAREAQILDRVVAEATREGVDEAFAQTFFKHQFDASKIVQQRLHDKWRQAEHPPFDNPPDLAKDIRPKLDQLTPQLIASLRDFQRVAKSADTRQYLERHAKAVVHDDVGGEAREMALRPLFEATDI